VTDVLNLFLNAYDTVFTHYTLRSMFVNGILRYEQYSSSIRIIFSRMDATRKAFTGIVQLISPRKGDKKAT
jgi:hypothetical protein